jgi:two-component system sensor histidine kinase TtrS
MLYKMLWLLVLLFSALHAKDGVVNIGVLAFESKADTQKEWTPTENFLNQSIKQYQFQIIPMNYPELDKAVHTGTIDFVITNSGHYVKLEAQEKINRVATMTKYKKHEWLNSFGGVIFTRSDNKDITELKDLKTKKVAAVDEESLGGYSAQMYELKKLKIEKSDISLSFTGLPHNNVVKKVLNKEVDAGFVRTEVLENLITNGALDPNAIKIVNAQKEIKFPFFLSTPLYPEWPIASMQKTPFDLVNSVVITLLSMNNSVEPKEGEVRWMAPLDYWDIHSMFKALHLPPYNKPHSFTAADVYEKYKFSLTALFVFIVFAILLIGRELYTRKKLERLFEDLAVSNENFKTQSIKNEMLL